MFELKQRLKLIRNEIKSWKLKIIEIQIIIFNFQMTYADGLHKIFRCNGPQTIKLHQTVTQRGIEIIAMPKSTIHAMICTSMNHTASAAKQYEIDFRPCPEAEES